MVKESHNDEDVTGLLREAEIMKVKFSLKKMDINIKIIRFSTVFFSTCFFYKAVKYLGNKNMKLIFHVLSFSASEYL